VPAAGAGAGGPSGARVMSASLIGARAGQVGAAAQARAMMRCDGEEGRAWASDGWLVLVWFSNKTSKHVFFEKKISHA